MISRIDTWYLLYRQQLILRGTDTNNFSEVMFHILKYISLNLHWKISPHALYVVSETCFSDNI